VTGTTDLRPTMRGATPPASGRRRRRVPDLLPYVLVTPLAGFIIGLALVPAGLALVQSFYTVQELNPPVRFAGLDNFRRLFSDDAVLASMGNTGLYVLFGVALSTLLGIVMAMTLRHPFRGRSVLIAIMVLPWALPGVVEGIVWTGIGLERRAAQQRPELAAPDQRLSRVPRQQPAVDHPRDRAGAGLADHPAVRTADPGRAAERAG